MARKSQALKSSNPSNLPEKALAYVHSTSEMFAKWYHQPTESIYEIMQLLAKPLDGVDPDSRGFTYPRQIDNFLLHIPAEKILRLIHSEGQDNFRKLLGFVDYIENIFTPLYSLEELTEIISSFRSHLITNTEAFEETGYPEKLFKKSKWLDSRLNKLYFTKIADIRTKRNSLQFAWIGWTPGLKKRIENCSYENAAYITPKLKDADAQRLEEDRHEVHSIKLRVLKILRDSLKTKSFKTLWQDCLDILKKNFDVEDVKFFLRMDSLYDKHHLAALDRPAFPDVACSGGLTDILMVVGHVEQELRSQSHSDIRSHLGSCIKTELSYGSRLDTGKFLRNVIFCSQSERLAFVDCMDRTLSKDDRFWEEFFKRVKTAFRMEFGDLIILPKDVISFLQQLAEEHSVSARKTIDTEKISAQSAKSDKQYELIAFEDDNSLLYRKKNFHLPQKHFLAILFLIEQHKKGNPWVRKENVYNFCDVPDYVRDMSIIKWFKANRGEAQLFANTGILKNDGKGRCRISPDPDLMEIRQVEPPPEYDGKEEIENYS